MDILKQRFQEVASSVAQEAKDFLKSHGDQKIDQVTVSQVFGGMRGIKSMLWETSELDPEEGIRFRGYSIPALQEKLPKINGSTEPMPEGLFWLMLVGEGHAISLILLCHFKRYRSKSFCRSSCRFTINSQTCCSEEALRGRFIAKKNFISGQESRGICSSCNIFCSSI